MTNKQNAKLNMGQRVYDTLGANQPLIIAISPMNDAYTELGGILTNIRQTEQAQGKTTVSAASKDKADAESTMIDRCLVIANCLYVIGINTRNNELQTQTNITSSSFVNVEDNEKLALAKQIVELAAPRAVDLEPFGIGADTIDAFAQATDAYHTVIAKPMDSIGTRKQKTTSLQHLFPLMKLTLEDKLDKMMILFKDKHPDFYNEYKTARNLINSAIRHRKNNDEGENGDNGKQPE